MILSPLALDALRHMRLAATYVDLPGLWPRNVFVQTFGLAVLAELLGAGLVRCGGTPDAVPIEFSRELGDTVAMSRRVAAFNEAVGSPIYPLPGDTLLLTHAGWRHEGRLVARNDRRTRRPRAMPQLVAMPESDAEASPCA